MNAAPANNFPAVQPKACHRLRLGLCCQFATERIMGATRSWEPRSLSYCGRELGSLALLLPGACSVLVRRKRQ